MRNKEARRFIKEVGRIIADIPMSERSHFDMVRRFTILFQQPPWDRRDVFDAGEFLAWSNGIDDDDDLTDKEAAEPDELEELLRNDSDDEDTETGD